MLKNQSLKKQVMNPSIKSVFSVLVLVGMATTILTLFMYLFFIKEPAKETGLIIASILNFPLSRVSLYGICFAMGIYTFHKNWFYGREIPWNPLAWLLLTLSFLLVEEMIYARLISQFTPALGVAHVTIKSFLVYSIIITLMAFGAKYWNNGSKINRLLSNNSYIIYLIHFVIVLSIQLVIYKWWDVAIYLKFIIGSILALSLSFLLSEFVVRRYPKYSILGIVSFFGVLVLVYN